LKTGLHDFSLTFTAKLVTIITVLGTQSCLAWFLGPEGRGSYAVCVIFAMVLSTFFVIGCDVASLYFVASGRFSISEGLTYTLIYGGIGSLLAMAVGLGILQFDFPFLSKAGRLAFHLALLSIPFSLFSLILLNLLTAVRHFTQYALVLIGQGLSNLIFVLIYVRLLGGGVNGALLAVITASLITILFTLYLFRRDFAVTWCRPKLARLKEMIHYGARYYLGKISNMANFQIGTIILAFFAGKAEIAFFAVAMRVAVQVLIIPDALTSVLIPRSARDQEGKKKLVALCSRLTALICGLGLLVLGLLAEPLVKLVFSPAFLPAVPLIRIVCLGVWIRAAGKVFVPYLIGTDHPGIASLSVGAGMLVNLAALAVFLPRLGLPGAALAVTLSYFVSSTILLIGFMRFSGLTLRQTWAPRRTDLNFLIELIRSRGKGKLTDAT